jgi:predicted phage-related endonuclease
MERQKKAIENRIRLEMKDAASVVLPGGAKIHWKQNRPSRVTDWKAAFEEASELLDKEKFAAIVAATTAEQPGDRPLRKYLSKLS